MIVVDTNVIGYLLIEGDRTTPARSLWHDKPDWRVPPLWRHEFLNVLATFVRRGGANLAEMAALWTHAIETIGPGETEVDMLAVLKMAVTIRDPRQAIGRSVGDRRQEVAGDISGLNLSITVGTRELLEVGARQSGNGGFLASQSAR